MRRLAVGLSIAAALLVPRVADAFCGFYVSEAAEGLHADATAVTLMRKGQATVMAMENNYTGPPRDFAMVVPVPEVLDKQQVKTLEDGVFERVKRQTAPRLVEYWEQDPCPEPESTTHYDFGPGAVEGDLVKPDASAKVGGGPKKVKVEERFTRGEYDIVVLSAEESNALDTWLRRNDYNIPKGAETYFRPYIQRGSYFFVAKVNVDRLTFNSGTATLSPLRFHYESEDFRLPIRLGLINSSGTQDLLAFTIAESQRYRVANRQNVTIPTNLVVGESVTDHFPAFYDRIFTRTTEANEDAVVTEYTWRAGQCDPCPVEPMSRSDFRTLGGDVIDDVGEESASGEDELLPETIEFASDTLDTDAVAARMRDLRAEARWCARPFAESKGIHDGNIVIEFQIGPSGRVRGYSIQRDDFGGAANCFGSEFMTRDFSDALTMSTRSVVTVKKTFRLEDVRPPGTRPGPDGWTITRLHYRYDKQRGGRDLVFEKAPPIAGGRGTPTGLPGHKSFSIPSGRRGSPDRNQFQGRYMVLHEWDGKLDCSSPDRGRWGRKDRGSGSVTTGSGRATSTTLESSLEDLVTEGELPAGD